MQEIFQVAQRAIYRKESLIRSRAYRQFIKSFACTVCRKRWGIDPAHTGSHGVSQKSSDASCIPLCRQHHREMDRGPREFARKYKLDIPQLIERFNRLWQARKPESRKERNVA